MASKPYFLTANIEEDEQFNSLKSSVQESIISLRNHGYCILKPQLEADFATKIINDCTDEYGKPGNEGRIAHAYSFSENVKALALNKEILDLLRTAFGREPFAFQTLNFERGSEQKSHSDSIHFNTYPYGFMCGAWVALEDVDEMNGPLHYYPGSHKLPFFGMDQFAIHGADAPEVGAYYEDYEQGVQQLIKSLGLKKESVKVSRGECLIWAANLFHGGDPIKDQSRTRHSQVTHYFFEDCFYYTPLLSSPFKNEYFIRQPKNVVDGKVISVADQKKFASAVGIDIQTLSNDKQSKSFLGRLFGSH